MAKTPTHPGVAGVAAKSENWDDASAEPAPTVKVRCIVHTLPHTGIADPGAKGLGMAHKEERDVPEEVALAMHAAGQVELI
jgi:hypothetical protein